MIEIEEIQESENVTHQHKDEPENRLLTEDDEVNQEDPSSVNIPTQIS